MKLMSCLGPCCKRALLNMSICKVFKKQKKMQVSQLSELVFIPWYCIVEEVSVGPYRLTPYFRGKTNTNIQNILQTVELILKTYLERPYTSADAKSCRGELPIKNATVVLRDDRDINLDEMEVLQHISGFSGISNRRFSTSDNYLCSENFKFIIQKIPREISDPFDPYTSTRRKDGNNGTVYSPGLFREVKPQHIANQWLSGNLDNRLKFDEEIANCIWSFFKGRGPEKSFWDKNLYPAIFSFYQANTDSHSHHVDCIYSQSAIERLILGGGHKEDNLIIEMNNFLTAKGFSFSSIISTTRSWQSVTYNHNNQQVPSASIFEAWLRELTRLRNKFAHGNYTPAGNWVWTLEEHLILSAFVFPLLVKLYVSQFNARITYTISNDDLNKLGRFDQLLSIDNYHEETFQYSGYTNWGKVLYNALWD